MRRYILRHLEDDDHTTLFLSLSLLACEGIYFDTILRKTTTPPLRLSFSLLLCGKSFERLCFLLLVETADTTKPSQTHKTKQPTPHLLLTEVEQEEDKTMDVTFVLEESGMTATVEVPCEADVAAAKEVACTALAVSPASVEMRIGTQVLEGTCRLQDTAFDAGVQVVLARRLADIKCPAQYTVSPHTEHLSLSPCGTLCVFYHDNWVMSFGGFDTETFETAFEFDIHLSGRGPPAISRCKTRCYMAFGHYLAEVALPSGEVLRKVDCSSFSVFACGGVVVSKGKDGVSVYDKDFTLLRSISHKGCREVAVSDCGGWVITSSWEEPNVRLWDVNTGEAVACVPANGGHVAISQAASVFAVASSDEMQLYDWSGAALACLEKEEYRCVCGVQFTPCGKYLVLVLGRGEYAAYNLHQYDVTTMSCVRVIQDSAHIFVISPCSHVVMFESSERGALVTQHLYPY